MSDNAEHKKKRMERFKKAQKILDLEFDDFVDKWRQLGLEADPSLLKDYEDYCGGLVESSNSGAMEYLDLFRFKAELDERKADDVIDYLSLGEPNYPAYDNSAFDLMDRANFVMLTGEFRESHNRYFVIKGYVALVNAKIAPPAWMLEALAQGFSKHLRNPDPQQLGAQLGLQGEGSGKTNPYDDYRRFIERRDAVVEMLILIKEFGVSRVNAARAVKTKRKLTVSEKRLCNDYRKYEKDREEVLPELDFSLSPLDRQKLVESFPVSARKLLRKKGPVKK